MVIVEALAELLQFVIDSKHLSHDVVLEIIGTSAFPCFQFISSISYSTSAQIMLISREFLVFWSHIYYFYTCVLGLFYLSFYFNAFVLGVDSRGFNTLKNRSRLEITIKLTILEPF